MLELAHPLLLPTALVLAASWLAWALFKKPKKLGPPLPPGPPGLPLVGNLLSLKPDLHSHLAILSQIYGPILSLRLGRKLTIVVSSPAIVREILRENDITFANHDVTAAAKEATYGGRSIAWAPHGPEYIMLRRVAVRQMLNVTILNSVYPLRRLEIRKLIGYLYSRVGSPVTIGEQAVVTLLNVATNMAWGGAVMGEDRALIGAEFRKLFSGIMQLLGKPNISDLYPGLARFDLQGIAKKMKGLAKRMDAILEAVIDQQVKMDGTGDGGKESKNLLQFLLRMKDEADAKTRLDITLTKVLLMDMVVGGTDTTSNTVEFAMAEILNKPKVMQKLQLELDTVVGKDNKVEESHIPKLPFLQAVMKETLRLHPTLPLLIPYTPSQTCTVGGYSIPEGTRVLINVWAIHRDPSVWERPLEFDPDRFVGGKWDYNGTQFDYFPFGAGRRICPGIAMAERTFMFLLASLVHSFDWKLPEGEKVDLSEKFGIVLNMKTPLIAVPTARLSDPALYQ